MPSIGRPPPGPVPAPVIAPPVAPAAPLPAAPAPAEPPRGRHLLPGAEPAETRRVLRTFFAPYDAPIQQDIAHIREMIEARRADPRQFASDAENPYKILYAVYNLRNPEVVRLLGEAHQVGVDVQVLIEQHQLDPEKTWNTTDEELIAAGFSFSPTQKGLTPAEREELDLIGIEGPGFMHLKARIFSRPDLVNGGTIEKVLTGSMNPGDESANNHETLHLLEDPVVVERYKAKYRAVREGKELPNVWTDDAPINVLFTPTTRGPQPADAILKLIDQEREAIFLSVFSLRNFTGQRERASLLDKLKAAKERGVEIVVVTDRKQSDGVDWQGNRIGHDDDTEDRIRGLGIPVYECINEAGPFNAMHNKSAVFGLSHMKVVSDTGNWSQAALGARGRPARNDESYLFIDSKRLDDNHTGQRYLSNFLYLLRRYSHQQVDGDPSAEALIQRLSSHPAWPKVRVDFDVLAKTYYGQEVYVTGDHPALGDWTRATPGLKLHTDGARYPTWQSDHALELPFGTLLEYKVVKRDRRTGALEWDGRKNQLLVVDPGDEQNPARDGDRIKVRDRFSR